MQPESFAFCGNCNCFRQRFDPCCRDKDQLASWLCLHISLEESFPFVAYDLQGSVKGKGARPLRILGRTPLSRSQLVIQGWQAPLLPEESVPILLYQVHLVIIKPANKIAECSCSVLQQR